MVTANDLITSYLPLAKSIAWERRNANPTINIDELKSAAYMGLVIAADRFDPSQSHFPHYARIKIDGAILDYVREVRGRTHKYESMDDDMSERLTQRASYQEILEQITENLSEEGKSIFQMYYLEGLNLKEISAKLGVSESRVSQIFSKYRKQIQEEYQDEEILKW